MLTADRDGAGASAEAVLETVVSAAMAAPGAPRRHLQVRPVLRQTLYQSMRPDCSRSLRVLWLTDRSGRAQVAIKNDPLGVSYFETSIPVDALPADAA